MPVSLRVTYEDAAKSARLVRVEENANLAQLRQILVGRTLMQQADVFIISDSIVDDESELQIRDLPAPADGVKTVKLRSGQNPAQLLMVQSDRDEQDSYPLRPESDPKALTLSGLRATLGSWLDAKDRFLTKQKAVINGADEARWPVSDIADNGIIRVRKTAPQAAVTLTVQSDKDERDSHPVRIETDPKALMLSGLRTALGSWLDTRDRFLTKQKAVIDTNDEGRWPASDVTDNGVVRVRKAAWSR